jgi:hypothetical protein
LSVLASNATIGRITIGVPTTIKATPRAKRAQRAVFWSFAVSETYLALSFELLETYLALYRLFIDFG